MAIFRSTVDETQIHETDNEAAIKRLTGSPSWEEIDADEQGNSDPETGDNSDGTQREPAA